MLYQKAEMFLLKNNLQFSIKSVIQKETINNLKTIFEVFVIEISFEIAQTMKNEVFHLYKS